MIMATQAFNQQGNTQTFTAAVTPPAPVQAVSSTGAANQYRVINNSIVTVFLGVGTTAALATTNATSTMPSRAIPLLPGTDEILTFTPDAYFTGATASSTAVVYITPGTGS
ncbi:MAG: hypothetical protein EBS18_05205 [Actinobacteria bacterium]|nr:hypothetical protein [Actinomycetota bacterium]